MNNLYILILKTCQIEEFDLIGISVYCKLKNKKKQNEPIEFIIKVEEFNLNSSSLSVCETIERN